MLPVNQKQIDVYKRQRLDDVQVFCQDGLEESMKYVSEGKIKGDSWHGIWEWCWYGAEYCVRAALDLEPESQVFDVHARSIILPLSLIHI